MRRQYSILIFTAYFSACAIAPNIPTEGDIRMRLSDIAMIPVNFESGEKTIECEKILDSDEKFICRALSLNLAAIVNYNDLRFEVIGFTDNEECRPDECKRLSAGRAEAVHAWLISHGANSSSFVRVEGRGAATPVAENSTEEGRAVNRRVEVNQVPYP